MKINKILDYIYPPRCPVCERISPDGVCERCRPNLKWVKQDYCMKCGKPLEDAQEEYCADCRRRRHFFVQGRALLSYEGAVKLSLYRMKYANKREYAKCYGKEMARALGPWVRQRGITRIVPVPLHASRRRQRGYNQAAWIAKALGEQLHIPVDEKSLVRQKKTVPLKKLDGRQRRENLQEAFSLRRPIPPGERILLVDDIYTTGSTVDEAAKCLIRAAGSTVFVMTVAIGG